MTGTDAKRGSSNRSVLIVMLGLLAIAVVIAVGSLLYGYAQDADAEFGGADGQAEEVIVEVDPEYESWFSPLVGELPGEVESGLFALQAGIGGIVLGFGIGWYAGRNRGRSETPAVSSAPASLAADTDRPGD
ncbi:energy-coupling factor ABC transporter substrate-binding protein [Gordonia sp. PKS22-38]|uniref:Cobalt transport protein CbiN n=1 Tax=Gordonia prachuapensis TaxID=3115651 RepID=A0ABU7MRV2_9ACTN|nr:energy-coupling factor ABC transporter substrate-binding protein [Gordonia sp. PKS22-38]